MNSAFDVERFLSACIKCSFHEGERALVGGFCWVVEFVVLGVLWEVSGRRIRLFRRGVLLAGAAPADSPDCRPAVEKVAEKFQPDGPGKSSSGIQSKARRDADRTVAGRRMPLLFARLDSDTDTATIPPMARVGAYESGRNTRTEYQEQQ